MPNSALHYMYKTIIVLLIAGILSCSSTTRKNIESWESEILDTEKEFAQLAQKEGVLKAFAEFADDSAVLLRNNSLYIGKDALINYYQRSSLDENAELTWEPEFISVASSGDMAYTYGYYTYSFLDSNEMKVENRGVYHTVWKRQPDDTWKFVWD